MRLTPSLLLAALVLAGCQTAPPTFEVPQAQSYPASKEDVWQRTIVALAAQGLEVWQADFAAGRIEGGLTGVDEPGWAWCERARVVERFGDARRIDRARPLDRNLALTIDLQERDELTEVALASSFTETQIDPFRNLPLSQRCRSTGELERSLLAAI